MISLLLVFWWINQSRGINTFPLRMRKRRTGEKCCLETKSNKAPIKATFHNKYKYERNYHSITTFQQLQKIHQKWWFWQNGEKYMRLKGKYPWRKLMLLIKRLIKNLSFHIASFKLAQRLMKMHLCITFDAINMNFDRFERHRKDFVMNRYSSQTECNFNLCKLQEWR